MSTPQKTSAGLILYRRREGTLQVFLVHPGGPFWKDKEDGAWTIPKGGVQEGEDFLTAAKREFQEETGLTPKEPYLSLHPIRQRSGKIVHAWAFESDCEPGQVQSNPFTMEWPPHSGRMCEFPEIDRAAFWSLEQAKRKINPAQIALLEELQGKIVSAS